MFGMQPCKSFNFVGRNVTTLLVNFVVTCEFCESYLISIITVIMCTLEEEFFDCVEEIVEEYFDALEQFDDQKPTLPPKPTEPFSLKSGKHPTAQKEVANEDQTKPLLLTELVVVEKRGQPPKIFIIIVNTFFYNIMSKVLYNRTSIDDLFSKYLH
ncbi:hypothetical protein EB796_013049 [Bugula neritina]|uniref:Uncharacterized protein n=1 Tax=Bugula neritina TaxID=10212 RepID=A0A7J7JT28_BUGNE|nr:hypothetical protein EB796_013049 [Bugula neritina]